MSYLIIHIKHLSIFIIFYLINYFLLCFLFYKYPHPATFFQKIIISQKEEFINPYVHPTLGVYFLLLNFR